MRVFLYVHAKSHLSTLLYYLQLSIFVIFILSACVYIFITYPNYLKGRRNFFKKVDIEDVLTSPNFQSTTKPTITIQVTTIGGETNVIKSGLRQLDKLLASLPSVLRIFSLTIVTEAETDVHEFENLDFKSEMAYEVILVPPEYQTPKNTLLKARALQYSLEQRIKQSRVSDNHYILLFDAESTIRMNGLLAILHTIGHASNTDKVFQGPIFYSNFWKESNIFSKQMESLRPWSCFECLANMRTDRTFHLHGSNLLIRSDFEAMVSWDFGKLYDAPLIAEDLLFGLKAYLMEGSSIFRWHGGTLIEQPPFFIHDSITQRIRWIRGTWQALDVVKDWPEYQQLSDKEQSRIQRQPAMKSYLYGLGFIPASVSLIPIFYTFMMIINKILSFFAKSAGFSYPFQGKPIMDAFNPDLPNIIKYISLVGALLWLLSIQIGLHYNLRFSDLPAHQRLLEHLKILLISPFAAFIDTGTALYTTISWKLGKKSATWTVTQKRAKPKQKFLKPANLKDSG